MHNGIFTSAIAALALFAVVGLVAALAPSIAPLNLARAHAGDASLTALTVTATADGTAQTLSPAFSSTVTDYTLHVDNSVAQVTIAGTPDGDGIVTYDTDADSGTDGHQVNLPTLGRKLISVVVTHTDSGTTATQTYTVLVIREGTVATDQAALMDLYNSTDGANWRINTNWGSTEPLDMWHGVTTNTDGRVTNLMLVRINLSGTIPASLGTLTNLTTLSLSYNQQLSGTIPASLANLTSLTKLELYRNTLSGPIPDWVGDLTDLTLLYLYNNQLTGTIPDLSSLISLQYLSLSRNKLSGTIPASLGNLTSLTELSLNTNSLSGTIPDLSNLASLTELRLHTNALTGTIPDWVGDLTSLTYLGLHVNELSGQIPASLDNLTSLTSLILYSNALSGTIPDLSNLTSLSFLYLHRNALTGTIPDWVGDLTSLEYLNLDRNQLSGTIPDSLGNVARLKHLVLYDNKLTGQIPDSLGGLANLEWLYLSGNALSGTIPDSLGNLSNLTALSLWNNQLSGQIPASLGNLTKLTTLSISVNNFDGPIPDLSRLTSLWYLFLRDNQLSGGIPTTLNSLTNLRQLSLQNNQLSGSIPNLSSLTNLQQLYLQNNALTGAIPDLSSLVNLTVLSLRNNEMTGPIPAWLGQRTGMTRLYLRNNQLSGDFPAALGNLTDLTIARFASNPSLTGCVPNGLRYLIGAPPPDPNVPAIPAQDFIAVDANGDGDTDDPDDTPGLNLPFCMLSTLAFSDVTLAFASGTAAYTADVVNTVESTTVTATLDADASSSDGLSIMKGTTSYTSGAAVPLAVGPNEFSITVTPTDGTPTLTYTVTIFREGLDRATLIALYNSAGGASWTDKDNWGETGVVISLWEGVTTDVNDRVTTLDLSNSNLSGGLPAALGSLTSLTTLNLSGNQVTGAIPDLSALSSLTTLNLGDNQVSGTIPDWLSSLTSLTTLNLRDNGLTGPIPDALGNLNQLDVLYLDNNQLSGPIPAALGDLSGLQATRFAGNSLTGCVPDGLRRLVGAPEFESLPAHDFIAVDATNDGDTADVGDTPGLELPFCTLRTLTFSGNVTLELAFASDTATYAASADHNVTSTTVTATLYNSGDTISITKGVDTYTNGDSVPLEVGTNVITISVTTMDDTPSPHTYTVTVTRAPNTPPTFSDGLTTTRGVEENTAAGMNIGEPVAATDADSDTLTYSLDTTSAASFDISSTTGQLQTKAALDFEDKSSYTVTVSVRDSKDSNGDADEVTDDTITVTIQVANLNEAPVFPTSETGMRSVNENTGAGMNIGVPIAATDDDNDTLTYSLDDGIDADSFSIDASSGQLLTKAALDYETGTISYTVTVTAVDPSGADDTITVTITVNNVDEAGTVTLSSTQPVEEIRLTATLDDPDDVSGSVTWSWARSPNGTSSWTLISGATSTSYTPVFDDVDRYLRATASYTDGEGSGKSAQVVSANRVQPAPNDPPEFLAIEPDLHHVDENTSAGEDIGPPVAATDPDGDTLTYSLDVTSRATFGIDASSGQLLTKAALDYETTPSYTVTVTVTDTAGEIDTIEVTITVNNVEEAGTVTLSSTQPIAETPLTATLDDPDVVNLGSVTWSWESSPNSNSPWTIISGETSATYTPVAADENHYLRATASYTDEQGSDKSAQAVSTNTVQPAPVGPNEPPVFSSTSTTRDVDENTVAGVNIGPPVAATDADGDTLTYSLDVAGAASFDIDSTDGQLQTKAALDFETTASYSVTVTATDPAGETDTITVTITINNVDEPGTVTLSSLQPIAGTPLTATLDDPDGVSGSVTWSWAGSSNGSSSWTLISGATSAAYTPVAADVGDYLQATASYTDGEGLGKSAEGVSANVVQAAPVTPNEPPVFPTIEPDLHDVDENTPAGVNIGEPVAATDPEDDTLTYSLDVDGAASFDIGSTTGQLQTKAALDFETTPNYSVTVTATDTGAATDTIIITITVNNLDEAGTVTLSSQQPLVAFPLTATLDDPDKVSGSETWLWERSPDGASDWTPISGETSATYTPVADDVGDYLQATASYTDGAGSGKSAQAISANAVQVAPGRNAPVFKEGPTATRSVPKNTPAGRNIGAPVSATDADNDLLTYSLGGRNAVRFDLDASSGQLSTKVPVDRVFDTSYTVSVSVSDGKDDLGEPETDPQIDTSTEVTINVTTTTTTTTRPSGGSSGGGGGGGGGGGSSRATPTPTPTPSPTPTATPTPTGPQFSGLIAAEPSVTATVVPEGTTLGLNGGADLPGGIYVNFPPTAVALPVHVSVSVSNEAPSDVIAPSGTTLLPLTINITPETPLTLGTPLTIEINPTPEQLRAVRGDLNNLSVGVVTPNGIVVLPAQVLHGRLVVTIDHLSTFVLLAVTDPGPLLTQPPMGDASSMGPLLKWTQPPRTTWFQVQVIPFNEDGPGINLVIGDGALVRAAQYQVLGPNFGSADPNYVMLPGMTYLWRVRTATVLTNPTEADWSAWAVSSFKTPPASSSTITPVAPPAFGQVSTLTPTLTWTNSNTAVFYYEVQVSKDYEFGPNAFLYSEYVHGGASTPPNSYVVPEAFPLEAGEIYYWRVRPRIQGDGDPLPWSATYVFLAPPG